MAGKPNKAGKSGKPSPAVKRGGRRPASAQQHPGEVLREILADTPPALAAKWFGLSATELEAFYHGELPLTPAMAETAGSIFGRSPLARHDGRLGRGSRDREGRPLMRKPKHFLHSH